MLESYESSIESSIPYSFDWLHIDNLYIDFIKLSLTYPYLLIVVFNTVSIDEILTICILFTQNYRLSIKS